MHLFIDVPAASWDEARAFWAAALGCRLSPERGETGQFVTLLPPDGDAWVKLQRVDGAGGVHLDVDTPDRAAGLRALLGAGASPAWRYHDVEVVRSPGGLAVCCTVGDPGRRLFRAADAVLDQIAIDVPRLWWDAESAFWQAVTGREPVPSKRGEFVNLAGDAAGRVLLHRLDEPDGPVRAHPDLAVRDRAAETVRHRALGAEVVAVRERWTVLRAPGGQVYCLTDRDPATGW